MSRFQLSIALSLVAIIGTQGDGLQAQQVQLTAPFHSINDSFYENFGTGWGLNGGGRNWFFNTGPATSAAPPFGGWDPGSDARFGFGGVTGGGLGFNFNWLGGQGSNRSHVMQAPTIVVPNGGSGSLFSGSIRPFVTGVFPVVGNAPRMPMVPVVTPQASTSPVQERLDRLRQQEAMAAQAAQQLPVEPAEPAAPARDDDALVLRGGAGAAVPAAGGGRSRSSAGSTANHGDISLDEIRRQQAQEDAAREQEILVKIEKARGCEEAGKPGVAKIYYEQAARQAEGELKRKLLAKINSLSQ